MEAVAVPDTAAAVVGMDSVVVALAVHLLVPVT
jgi:hypothetical protein